jgi:hypothetical protein
LNGLEWLCHYHNCNCLQLWKTVTDSLVTIGYGSVWFAVILQFYGPDLKALLICQSHPIEATIDEAAKTSFGWYTTDYHRSFVEDGQSDKGVRGMSHAMAKGSKGAQGLLLMWGSLGEAPK